MKKKNNGCLNLTNLKKQNKMEKLINTTGTKGVNISTDATGIVRAFYVQIYNGEEQILEAKSYKSMKAAKKWANKKLK